ncbi:MAG: UPF0149 family protein [Gammaproteobacteria bacterium]|nr:UPF0149 family protein [Gammaproteobacteria bacterium]
MRARSASSHDNARALHAAIEERLQNSDWKGGASEAHGLLSALACRGVQHVHGKAWLLRLSSESDLELVDAMFGEILRDLRGDAFAFKLLLPEDSAERARRIDALADWCGGFAQGFLHDGAEQLEGFPPAVRESFGDIMRISRIDNARHNGGERALVEIEEYLRAAAQVIFDELNPPSREVAGAGEH